jgi:hypothetical protein
VAYAAQTPFLLGALHTANCIIIAQILHLSLLFSGAALQNAPGQSDSSIGNWAIIMQFAVSL